MLFEFFMQGGVMDEMVKWMMFVVGCFGMLVIQVVELLQYVLMLEDLYVVILEGSFVQFVIIVCIVLVVFCIDCFGVFIYCIVGKDCIGFVLVFFFLFVEVFWDVVVVDYIQMEINFVCGFVEVFIGFIIVFGILFILELDIFVIKVLVLVIEIVMDWIVMYYGDVVGYLCYGGLMDEEIVELCWVLCGEDV